MVINFLPVDSKRDAIQLSDKPRLRNDPILYSRRSRATVSRRRDLILRAAHCHSSRAISSSVPERTTSNSRVPGYRNDRCLGPNVAEENGWRGKGQRVRLKRRGKRESSRIMGVYRFLFSVAVETFKGRLSLSPFLSLYVGNCRKRIRRGATRRECLFSRARQSCGLGVSSMVNRGTLRPNGHGVCLFRFGVTTHPLQIAAGC